LGVGLLHPPLETREVRALGAQREHTQAALDEEEEEEEEEEREEWGWMTRTE
jgi:hypothetical protein